MQVEPLRVGEVTIEEVDVKTASEADVTAWIAYDEVMSQECPETPFEIQRHTVRTLPEDLALRLFVARDPDGAIVGDGQAVSNLAARYRDVCQGHVSVRPDRRGRGIGRALLRLIVDAADADERRLLVGWSSGRVPAGERFARGIGAESPHAFLVNTTTRSAIDLELLRAWIADGPVRAPDYSLFRIDGPYPEDLFETMIDLRRLLDGVTRGAIELEPLALTMDDMRTRERNGVGQTRWTLCARHDPTGEIVGFSEVWYFIDRPHILEQLNSAVRPAHRGRGLCKWLKAAMLERALRERPEIQEVRTLNLTTNAPILAINRALGFQPFMTATAWQVSIARARQQLAHDRLASV